MEESEQAIKLLVDGAWKQMSLRGVAAWCMESMGLSQIHGGCTLVRAMSSTGVEGLAVLQALRWAKSRGIKMVQILTDSLEVVNALCKVEDANSSIKNIVLDILDVVSLFDFVSVSKATRQDVKNAHNLARSRLCNHSG